MNNRPLALFALILAGVIYFFYISPTWNGSIAQTNMAIANDEQALAAAKEYSNKQQQLIATRDAIDPANLARLTTFLPDSVDNVRIILDLQALAARSGFSLSNIDVSTVSDTSAAGGMPNAEVSPVGSIDLSLSAVGTFSAFQNFLTGVENSQRLLDVRDISVTNSDTGLYTYRMTLRLYWLR